MYIYSDTDSIHTSLNSEELKQFCDIDNIRLGAWKIEEKARRGKFIRQKCYLEDIFVKEKYKGISLKFLKNLQKLCKKHKNNIKINGRKDFYKIKITCAGMPQSCYSQVEWDKFKTGFSCRRKTYI